MKRIKKTLIILGLFLIAIMVTSCASAQEFAFATDLVDGAKVTDTEYNFRLTVTYGDQKIEPEVNCNGILLGGQEGVYTASLRDGENVIEVIAEHGKESEVRSYTITKAGDTPSDGNSSTSDSDKQTLKVETSLTDGETVTEESYSFTVSASYGKDTCELEVSCNGILLSSSNGSYTASLHEGNNEIEINAWSGAYRTTKNYSVIYRADFAFTTTLEDAQIQNDSVSFSAFATFNDGACPYIVTHNGKELQADGDLYHATLVTGNNQFIITARVGDHIKTKEWNIAYDGFELVTDLASKDTADNKISFRAAARYGSELCDLVVTVNGNTITPTSTKYDLTLETGENLIVFTTQVDNATKEYVYTVRYVDAVPTLTANIVNSKSYKGSVYSFDVVAKDGLGAKLSASQISFLIDWNAADSLDKFVTTNAVSLVWDDTTMTSFRINFKSAEFASKANEPFVLKIIATDGFGRSIDKTYTMTYTPVAANEPIGEVVFSLEGFSIGCGYFIEPVYVPIYEGVPFAKTLTDIITSRGWTYTNTGSINNNFYLASISGLDLSGNRIADGLWDFVKDRGYERSIALGSSLGEFDFGSGSGWMYSVNGVYKNYGFADYYPQDGDVVRVQFTVILGEDLGGGGALGDGSSGSLLDDNPDYAPIMKFLADIAKENTDKTVYNELISSICEWNISQAEMDKQINKLKTTYGK